MTITTIEGFELAGIALPTKTTNENGQAMVDCGGLWGQFIQEGYAEKVQHKVSDEVYAVYHNYEGDHTKPYAFFIGVKIAKGSPIPPGLERLIIPSNKYQIMKAIGKMPDCIGAAWMDIWKQPIDRMYAPDFEVYGEKAKDMGNAEVDIYLSIH